jgi:hypothetical protein
MPTPNCRSAVSPSEHDGFSRLNPFAKPLASASGKSTSKRCLTKPRRRSYLTNGLGMSPVGHGYFVDVCVNRQARGYSLQEVKRFTSILSPDLLSDDPSSPASFPANGRTLTEDVFDSFLAIFTNGRIMEDRVGPHGDRIAASPIRARPTKLRGESAEDDCETKIKQE